MQPLLKKLSEIRPPGLQYLGVAYGLTKELYNFWRKNGFQQVYMKQQKNDITSEYSCIMLKELHQLEETFKNEGENEQIVTNQNWLKNFTEDFKKRFITFLGYEFRALNISLCLSIMEPNLTNIVEEQAESTEDNTQITKEQIEYHLTQYDLKRLHAYSQNLIDYHLILDLVPIFARLYFEYKLGKKFRLSSGQGAILLGIGLQLRSIDSVGIELNIPVSHALALFNKSVRKFTKFIENIFNGEQQLEQKQVEEKLKKAQKKDTSAAQFAQELEQKGQKAKKKQIKSAFMEKYQVPDIESLSTCLLYTSDAADEEDSVDLGGRRILKKKKKTKKKRKGSRKEKKRKGESRNE
eukprot:TRINITY_DN6967_c0_g1_i2.p2 TRINITY_DN6967_c0_g1~~TRINITY_DN6967_c0_g1_i2.p2  ORF type:complete len:352 (+),score=62.38 TRINITY_DN6967_c0_g1_i2:1053-2108(+)